jgi:hypothetical protein
MAKYLSEEDLADFHGSPSTFVRFGLASIVRWEVEIVGKQGGRSVAFPEQYRWSSFNHYATGIRGVVEIESEWTARIRGPLIAMMPR